MPDISKIKIITEENSDEAYDVSDAKLRKALDILLGRVQDSTTIQDNTPED